MEEIEEIIISMLAIVVAFSIANWGIDVFFQGDFFLRAVVLMFTVGVGFISHELGHKYAAERFGSASRFMMWPQGLIFMLLLAPLGVIFAAPGAVYIFKPYMSKKENGIISLAGPVVNIVLWLFFMSVLIGSSLLSIELTQVVKEIVIFGMNINAMLAVFNLLPVLILDGAKVFNWNKGVWVAAFVLSVVMMLSSGSIVASALA